MPTKKNFKNNLKRHIVQAIVLFCQLADIYTIGFGAELIKEKA